MASALLAAHVTLVEVDVGGLDVGHAFFSFFFSFFPLGRRRCQEDG
jgi:hypothetical protein